MLRDACKISSMFRMWLLRLCFKEDSAALDTHHAQPSQLVLVAAAAAAATVAGPKRERKREGEEGQQRPKTKKNKFLAWLALQSASTLRLCQFG